MRSIGVPLVLATMVAAIACSGDRALAPTPGSAGQTVPPELIAAYTQIYLPPHGTAVALNDSGDVVGDEVGGGILWHGVAHERIPLPITPVAIANDGTVAGNLDGHAATWKNGRVTILDTAASVASAICKCESATVIGSVVVNGVEHAAIWVDGIRIDAGLPPNGVSARFVAVGGGFVVANASVRVPGDSAEYLEPYSWSHAKGWVGLRLGPVSDYAEVESMNSHGIAVGVSFGPHTTQRAIYFNVGAGTGDQRFPANPFFPDMRPTGINDSARISALGIFVDSHGFTNGNQVGLVGSISTGVIAALPPGIAQDWVTAGINNAGMIIGNDLVSAVLWTPKP